MDYRIQEHYTEAMQAHLFSVKSPVNVFMEQCGTVLLYKKQQTK